MSINKSDKKITLVMGGLEGGGAERVASHLIGKWIDFGYAVTLITMRDVEKDAYTIPDQVKRVVLGGHQETKNKFSALFFNALYVFKLRRAILRQESSNIISFITRANIYTILACLGTSKNVIISERNDTTRQKLPWPWIFLRKMLYKKANFVTANSRVSIDEMSSYVKKEKLIYIPNPVFIPPEDQNSKPSDFNSILYVARFIKHKRHLFLVKAFEYLKTETNEWNLILAGDGEERESIIQYCIKKNIDKKVELTGFVKNISQYYASSAIFVLPSLYEGTPNALLEAMAHGLCCVISDSIPQGKELIEDGVSGVIFKTHDMEDLSKKLQHLINNKHLIDKFGSNAKLKTQEFSIDNIINKWNELFIN